MCVTTVESNVKNYSSALVPTNSHCAIDIVSLKKQTQQKESVQGQRTIEAAQKAFGHLASDFGKLLDETCLPDYVAKTIKPEVDSKLSNDLQATEARQEIERLRAPSNNAVLRLAYLATIDGRIDGLRAKLPFVSEDLKVFVECHEACKKTARGFKYGGGFLTTVSVAAGTTVFIPNPIVVAIVSVSCGILATVGGFIFTGIWPDTSQIKLNDKGLRLGIVKDKLDEVALTIPSLLYSKNAEIRAFAKAAVSEINIGKIRNAIISSPAYSLSEEDIAPTLSLLEEAVSYANDRSKIPQNHHLKNAIINSLNLYTPEGVT